MKQSRYNILQKIENKFYIINTLNSSFVEIPEQDYNFIITSNSNLSEGISVKTYNNMHKRGMLIPDDINELDILKQRYNQEQNAKDLLTITIAPTLRCNFACSYCYENRYGKIITKEEQNKIIDFISKQLKMGYKNLNLIWFGGEPLLVFDIIKEMSNQIIELCDSYNVDYSAFLTTNGYLLSEEIILKLNDLKIKKLYVTLDGPKKIHDLRRCLVNGKGTFDKIVDNLIKAKWYGIEPIIRMNIDKTNSIYIEKLRNFVTNELKLGMYLGLVREYTDSCSDSNDIYFNKKQYADLEGTFNDKQSKDKYIDYSFPRQKPIYCRAAKIGTFVIDPDLNLFKCENDIGRSEKRISSVSDYPFDNEIDGVLNKKFYEWNPFKYKECCDCKILPICMGGCPFMSIKHNKPECETYKYNFDDYIKKYILQRKL